MKDERNKQWREYDEEGYEALAKYLLAYLRSCLPYCCGWMPYYYEYEPRKHMGEPRFSKHSDKTKDKK
ncbi:hypothetical protein CAFE_34710 [Caprobacter fermentans]|uniref:Uncharacterized protein n=1 Tax=Caproicibacter fermentans TaxID=2576756 RepID=A0A6N8I443_9FIRM|nr:hypothetical protein [Caproicibacter fermentans]MVB12728.1 hypothetical protein [Caproicibacter fermentans]QNK39275.1 hypothetical protein HCR03_10910 [Caproicibacter fermentans]